METLAIIAGILVNVVLLAIVVGAVVVVTRAIRRRSAGSDAFTGPHWYMIPFTSGADLLSQLVFALGIALAMIALTILARQLGWVSVSLRTTVLVGSALAIGVAYWKRWPLLLGLGVLGLFTWTGTWLAGWAKAVAAGAVAVLAGLALLSVCAWLVGRLHEGSDRTRRFAFVYWVLGLVGLVITLFWASSQAGLSALTIAGIRGLIIGQWRLDLGLGTLTVAAVALLALAVARKRTSVYEAGALGVIVAVFACFVAFPPSPAVTGGFFLFQSSAKLTAAGMAWAVVLNVVLLSGLLGLVVLGYAEHEDWLVNLGAVLLFLFVVIKYFDWLFTFLDRSLAFVVAGLLLLGVGLLMERGRRYVIKAMDGGEADA